MNLHYDRITGRIVSWGDQDSESDESCYAGCDVINLEPQFVDPVRHKIDLARRVIIARPATEIIAAMQREIVDAIAIELAATDSYMMPDRPITKAARTAWKDYRHALRALDGEPAAMLADWPLRPDGTDAAAVFRTQAKDLQS